MSSIVNFLCECFIIPSVPQSIIVISLVSMLGLLLSRLRLGKVSIGVTFVFFVGILASYYGLTLESNTLTFMTNFGLVLFIYAIGLQVGPAFFPSLKQGGLRSNLLSLLQVSLTLVMLVALFLMFDMPISDWVGLLSGATTNTPALAAGQSSLIGAGHGSGDLLSSMALVCAISYPMGVVGLILVLIFLAPRSHTANSSEEPEHTAKLNEYEVINEEIVGKSVAEVARLAERHFVISRIWRSGKTITPSSTSKLALGDRLLVVSSADDSARLEVLLGRKMDRDWNRSDIDWDHVDHTFVSRRLVLTRKELDGIRLSSLHLRQDYRVNITRIARAGIELLPSSDLHLQLGDRMTVVGTPESTDAVAKRIGNEIKDLDNPNLFALFLGLFISALVGGIPIYLPGVDAPIRLGLAGGGIVVGILMGAYGPRLHVTTYITNSASLLIRQLGLVLYLGCLGLASGAGFFEKIFSTQGALWLGLGVVMTIVPSLLMGLYLMRKQRMDYASTCGVLCGSMSNPMALEVIGARLAGNKHHVAYATVYPLSMFVRIVSVQLLILLFM